jgi:hypothetical protein
MVWFAANVRFLLLHSAQTGSGANPASYPIRTGGTAAGAWSWPFKNCGAITPLSHTSPWHGAQLRKHMNNFTVLNTYNRPSLPLCCYSAIMYVSKLLQRGAEDGGSTECAWVILVSSFVKKNNHDSCTAQCTLHIASYRVHYLIISVAVCPELFKLLRSDICDRVCS